MSQSWLNRKRRYFKTNFESFFVLVESFSLRLTFENFPPLHWFCLKLTVFSDSVRSITKNTQPIRCKTRPKLDPNSTQTRSLALGAREILPLLGLVTFVYVEYSLAACIVNPRSDWLLWLQLTYLQRQVIERRCGKLETC